MILMLDLRLTAFEKLHENTHRINKYTFIGSICIKRHNRHLPYIFISRSLSYLSLCFSVSLVISMLFMHTYFSFFITKYIQFSNITELLETARKRRTHGNGNSIVCACQWHGVLKKTARAIELKCICIISTHKKNCLTTAFHDETKTHTIFIVTIVIIKFSTMDFDCSNDTFQFI